MKQRAAAPGRILAAIVATYAAANVAWLAWAGVHVGGDSPMYMDSGARLASGAVTDVVPALHLGYLTVVGICQWIGLGLTGVALAQIAVAAGAIVAVYRMGVELSGATAGLLAAAIFACDLEAARWNTFILTDSFFISLVAISAWRVHRMTTPGANGRAMLGGVACLILLASLRPEGWLFVTAAAFYAALRNDRHAVRRAAIVGALLMCGPIAVAAVPRLQARVDRVFSLEGLRYGQTIWGSGAWRVPMPGEPNRALDREGVTPVVRYAAQHPFATAGLMLARIAVHVMHVRPF